MNDAAETLKKVCTRCRVEKPISDFALSKRDGLSCWCCACKADDMRTKRAADPEKFRARDRLRPTRPHKRETMRAWYAKNRERLCAKKKEWQANHPESGKARGIAYRREHADERAANARAWYAANPDRARATTRAYMRTHPERWAVYRHRRRARKASATGCFSASEWRDLKAKYDYRCLRCGKHEPEIVLTADHVVPLSGGGVNDIGNIQPLCGSCNSRKGTKTADYRPS